MHCGVPHRAIAPRKRKTPGSRVNANRASWKRPLAGKGAGSQDFDAVLATSATLLAVWASCVSRGL
jgi:hypothetical protein